MKTETREGLPIYCEVTAYEPFAGYDIIKNKKTALVRKYGENYPPGALLHVFPAHDNAFPYAINNKIPVVVIESAESTVAKLNPALLAMNGVLTPAELVEVMGKNYPYTDEDEEDYEGEQVKKVALNSVVSLVSFITQEKFNQLSQENQGVLISTPLEQLLRHPVLKHLFLPSIVETHRFHDKTMEDLLIFLYQNNMINDISEFQEIEDE